MERQEECLSNLNVSLKADGSSQNVPVSGGAEARRDHVQQQKESAGEVSDFIFAYRLEEVTYRVWTSHKPISYGQTESAGNAINEQRQEHQVAEEEGPEGFEIIGLDPDPFAGEDESYDYGMIVY